jgi:hypothetical protein
MGSSSSFFQAVHLWIKHESLRQQVLTKCKLYCVKIQENRWEENDVLLQKYTAHHDLRTGFRIYKAILFRYFYSVKVFKAFHYK